MADYGYTSVPGSAKLKTASRGADPMVDELEGLDPSAAAGRWVHGEWLCRTVVRGGAVQVLADVFDRLLPEHEAEEATTYLQLYRLSYGNERNWCRVSRRELRSRTRLSDRRLGGALAGLVEQGHVKLLHRNREGTLYRVLLPHEVFGEPSGDLVFAPRPKKGSRPKQGQATTGGGRKGRPKRPSPKEGAPEDQATPALGTSALSRRAAPTNTRSAKRRIRPESTGTLAGPQTQPAEELPQPSPGGPGPGGPSPAAPLDYENNSLSKQSINERRVGASRKRGARLTVGSVASAFLEQHGGRAKSKADVIEEVFQRMEEGALLAEVAEQLESFGRLAPKRLQIGDLGRWLFSRD